MPAPVTGMEDVNAQAKSFAEVGMPLYPNPNEGTEERFVTRDTEAGGALVMEQAFNGAMKGSHM